MPAILRQGTYGKVLEIDTKVDLSEFNVPGATTTLVVQKGEGTQVSWTATIKDPTAVPGDADFGILTYTLQEGDLDQAGSYSIHARLTKTSPPMNVYGTMVVLSVAKLYTKQSE